MRSNKAVLLALALSLFAAVAFGDSITSISPSSLTQYASEEVLTIDGSGLEGTVSTAVVYVGQAGQFTVPPISVSSTEVIADIPSSVTQFPGTVSVYVYADDGTGTRVIGPASLTINGLGSQPPLLAIPEVVTAEATSPSGANVSFTVGGISFVDPSPTVTCDHTSGALYPLGTTTVSCTATDSFSSTSGTFLIVVTDTVPPVLTLPAPITIVTNGSSATATWTASAVDNIDGSITPICSPASGSTFSLGVTTVRCEATDTHANTASGTFTVTVEQETPPTLILPSNITAEATGPNGAVVTYTATATDVIDGTDPVTCTPVSGSVFPLGTTQVQCSATNSHNLTSTGSFTITVVDTTPPTITVPSDITAEATGPNGAVVTFTATATDLVDGTDPVTCTPPSGSTFPLGTTAVVCTATDLHGNKATATFNVKVQDTTPPTVSSTTATPNVLWPPDHTMAHVTVSVVAFDLVDPDPQSHIVSVSSNQPINGLGDGDTAPDWVITGPLTVDLRAERSAVMGDRIYTITVATSDFSGNVAMSTVTVTVPASQGGHGRSAGH